MTEGPAYHHRTRMEWRQYRRERLWQGIQLFAVTLLLVGLVVAITMRVGNSTTVVVTPLADYTNYNPILDYEMQGVNVFFNGLSVVDSPMGPILVDAGGSFSEDGTMYVLVSLLDSGELYILDGRGNWASSLSGYEIRFVPKSCYRQTNLLTGITEEIFTIEWRPKPRIPDGCLET